MKLSTLQKCLIGLGLILGLFILTNPTATDFKEHLGRNNYIGLIREKNYLLFSVYKDAHTDKEYIAVLANFKEDTIKAQEVVDTAKSDPFAEFGGHAISSK